MGGGNDDSFRIQEEQELDEEDEKLEDGGEDEDDPEDKKGSGKKEKKGTWFFCFENPSNCTHWIKRIESAIEAHLSSHLPKKRVTGFTGMNESSEILGSREDEIELDPPPP